jgi:hypothetical protein
LTSSKRRMQQRITHNVLRRHLDRLTSLGVPLDALAELGTRQHPFGVTRVRTSRRQLWEPNEGGKWMAVVPVCEGGMGTVDLIAFRSTFPDQWWWRVGNIWSLGLDLLQSAPERLEVVATPLEWIARAGRALVILDWNAPAANWYRLLEVPRLAASLLLCRRLAATFRRIAPMPSLEAA